MTRKPVVLMLTVAAATLGVAAPAAAKDASPCQPREAIKLKSGNYIGAQFCPLTTSYVPVFNTDRSGNRATVVGRLYKGKSANWFVGQRAGSRYVLRAGIYNDKWAFTQADNGRWGWVPEVYFAGGANNEPDATLAPCFGPPLYRNICQV